MSVELSPPKPQDQSKNVTATLRTFHICSESKKDSSGKLPQAMDEMIWARTTQAQLTLLHAKNQMPVIKLKVLSLLFNYSFSIVHTV